MVERVDQTLAILQAAQVKTVKQDSEGVDAAKAQEQQPGIVLRRLTDEVDISEEGYASMAQQGGGGPASGESAQATADESVNAVLVKAQGSETSAVTTAQEAQSSSSANLSSLTEQQLQDMVSAGTITRTQADSELARRQGAQVAAEE